DVVVDVGANIGMFTLFALQQAPEIKVFAFEPNPAVCEVLRLNSELYGDGAVEVFECGLADRQGTAPFTFYPRASLWSGLYPDPEQDAAYLRAAVRNQHRPP